jgi:5-methylcytosine-specific restriction endonuclease McrA
VTKRRSTIPVLQIPSFGKPLPKPSRQYGHRRVREARKLKLIADPKCELCGELAMQVHHRIPILSGGHPWDFANLQSLCIACHSAAHGKSAPARWMGVRAVPQPDRQPDKPPDSCPVW